MKKILYKFTFSAVVISLLAMSISAQVPLLAFLQIFPVNSTTFSVADKSVKPEPKCRQEPCQTIVGSEQLNNFDQKKELASPTPPTDGRVILEINSWIIEEDSCECALPATNTIGFKNYAFLGLGFLPLLFPLIDHQDDDILVPPQPPTASPLRRAS